VPELPEVETIRRQLAPHLEGRTILGVEILDPRWTRPHPPRAVEAGLRSKTVERLTRSGKYLVIGLSGGSYLLIHLRMTGALLLDPAQEPRHTRVRFELDAGHRLVYIDPRRFGTGHLLPDERARDAYLAARIGVEPLSPEFTTEHLRLLARGRRAPVKAFLLDQRRVAGVGNIYADEALFRAKIHPLRATGSLTRPQLARLRDAVEQALQAGIEAKGASIDDFRHIDGARGAFQDRFLIHLRAGEPCVRCGAIVRKIVVGGRGTYVCERCQRKPRAQLAAGARATGAGRPGGPGPRPPRPPRSVVGPTRPASR